MKWFLALVFAEELNWNIFYNFFFRFGGEFAGTTGMIAMYFVIAWGQIVVYGILVNKFLQRRGI